MPKAIRFHETGGPEVLRFEDIEVGKPAPGEAQVRHTAIGLNFIEVYDRTGLYPTPLPSGLGREAAGVVTAVGRKVKGVRVGDRVAYVQQKPGAAAEVGNVAADRVVKIPTGVSDQQAAAIMLSICSDGRTGLPKGISSWSTRPPAVSACCCVSGQSLWGPR
jgi:NADPH2:quinone reductase